LQRRNGTEAQRLT